MSNFYLSRAGLGLILCYCFFASIYDACFAQIHLTVHFFPFPIFIGEILLFICLLLLGWVCRDGKSLGRCTVLLLGFYFGWVLLKASVNYYYDGPLTCRNAALFYYPVFAVFAYCFYQKAKISREVLISLAFLAAGIMFFKVMTIWCWWTYVTLFIIAVWNTKSVTLRWLGWIFLAVVFLLGKEYLYKGARAHFVSVLGAVVFLTAYFAILLAKRHDYVRLSILIASFLFFFLGYFIFSDRNDISSVTSLRGMINTYRMFDKRYQEDQATFVPQNLPVHLYNPKNLEKHIPAAASVPSQPAVSQPVTSKSAASQTIPSQPEASKVSKFQKFILNKVLRSRIREGREFDLDENNVVFRFFVWRDMARELIEKKAWWGFSFGHPQRSRSLEVLNWATSEWTRDGWITPHNSFFHIIYRAGILGIALIGILFFMVGRLTRDFSRMNSVEGGFLVGGLVYWLVLSNFFVILEFPYNAIIFWTLFGITWAYRDGLKAQAIK